MRIENFRLAGMNSNQYSMSTDTKFSAGRKEPLKVTTEYAYTEARARALLDACLAENVKKGWEKV